MNPFFPSSPAVRRIVTDYLRRWWWVLALAALYHFLFLFINISISKKTSVLVSMHAFFGGAALALRDRSAGTLRLAAALPVTEKERVSATRWTAVITPCALWLATGLVAGGILALTGGTAENAWECAMATCFLILATPAAFLTQTIAPATKPGAEGLQWRLSPGKTGLSAVMLILIMFGYNLVKAGSTTAPAVWFVLGVSAFGGWARVGKWVTTQPSGVDPSLEAATPIPVLGGVHPLRLWLRDTAVLGGVIGLGLGLFYFVLGFLHPLFWKDSLIAQQITFAVYFAGLFSAVRVASSLRPLRAVPVTAGRLAAFCFVAPVVGALSAVAGGLLVQTVTGGIHSVGTPHLLSWLCSILLLPITGCALLRFSGTTTGYILSLMLCVMPAVFTGIITEKVPSTGGALACVAAVIALFSWWWSRRLIARSSAIYQAMRFLPRPA